MVRIHVSRDRQTLGIFPAEEVSAGLKSGKFLPTDLGWKEGMDAWQPLAAFTDLPEAPDTNVGGAMEAPIVGATTAVDVAAVDASQVEPAWERRGQLGIGTAIYQTIIQVLTSPTATFSRMKQDGGFGGPLIYFLIIGVVVTFIAGIYNGLWNTYVPSEIFKSAPQYNSPGFIWIAVASVVFFSPIYLTIAAFLGAGITHLCLMITGGANKPFESTFRAVSYVVGSTQILMLIPFCGSLLAWGWNLVGLSIALKETHQTDTWRAVIAVLLPMIVCLGCFISVILAGIAAIAGQVTGQ